MRVRKPSNLIKYCCVILWRRFYVHDTHHFNDTHYLIWKKNSSETILSSKSRFVQLGFESFALIHLNDWIWAANQAEKHVGFFLIYFNSRWTFGTDEEMEIVYQIWMAQNYSRYSFFESRNNCLIIGIWSRIALKNPLSPFSRSKKVSSSKLRTKFRSCRVTKWLLVNWSKYLCVFFSILFQILLFF